jgi:hypothetical protein
MNIWLYISLYNLCGMFTFMYIYVGKPVFSSVVYVPYKANSDSALFTHIATANRDVKMTGTHVIPVQMYRSLYMYMNMYIHNDKILNEYSFHVSIHIYIHIYIHICTHRSNYILCMRYICIRTDVCICTEIYICIYLNLYACLYVNLCIKTCMHL